MLADELKTGKWLLVNKPKGMTSFGAVFTIRKAYQRLTREKLKVGHAGTLDPLASGLLIICTGRETKNIDRFMGLPKTYTGTLVLGASTPSFDMETEPDAHFPTGHITPDLIRETALTFLGVSHQIPPAFSAIKMGGKKAYDLARSGREVKMAPREIEITSFSISDIRFPEVDFEITCSKGTYIRSIAHDFGLRMNAGAYLKELCRTAIGNYSLTEAKSPVEWANGLFPEQETAAY
jgi:tRNA pseudouridine55 synthase